MYYLYNCQFCSAILPLGKPEIHCWITFLRVCSSIDKDMETIMLYNIIKVHRQMAVIRHHLEFDMEWNCIRVLCCIPQMT
jgi:hypothetical protein